MKTEIGISRKNTAAVTALLAADLSTEMVLYTKTRKAHWNVTGESFMELHKLFQDQYSQLEETIDEIAERIGKLGLQTIGTLQEFLKHSLIKESPGKYLSAKEIISELLKDHETIIVQLRKDIDGCAEKYKDAGTADLLTGIMEQHETQAWVLRRYLK